MTIGIDTNVLLRLIILDDPEQTVLARQEVERADFVVIALPVLCELAWVLKSRYRVNRDRIADFIAALTTTPFFVIDQTCVQTGLLALRAGADFADGAIAEQGRQLGARTFVSFDSRATKRLSAMGLDARPPGKANEWAG